MTLPSKTKRASKVLAFDSGGLPVALSQLDKSADTVTALGSDTPRTLAEHLATLPDAKITATGATTSRTLADHFGSLPYHPESFGIVADLENGTGTDQSAALQAMFDALPDGATVDFGDLQIYFSQDITVTKSVRLTGRGWTLYGDGAYLLVQGTLTELTSVASSATEGDSSLDLNDASGIEAGDLLIVQNTTSKSWYGNALDSRDYTDGEFVEVEAVENDTILLRGRLQTSYSGVSTDKVFRVQAPGFRAGGGTIRGDGGTFALRLVRCRGIELDLDVIGGTNAALSLHQCYDYRLTGGRYIHTAAASGANYGIGFSNSSAGYVARGVYAYGTRHGISMGGAPGDGSVPCRGIIVEGARIRGGTDGLHAADIHGWAADCYYRDCTVYGSVGIGGYNCGAPGSRIISGHTQGSKPIVLTEVVGGVLDFRGARVEFAPGNTADDVFGIASSAQFGAGEGMRDYDILLDGMTVVCTSDTVNIVDHLHNAPGDIRWTLSANNLTLLGDTSGLTNILKLTVSNTLSHANAPIRAERVEQQGVKCKNALTDSVFSPSLSGTWTGCTFLLPIVRGAGADGQYVRYPDGTQLCYHDQATANTAIGTDFMGGKRSAGLTWTFPAAFAAAPTVTASPKGATAFGATVSSVSTTQAIYFVTAIASQSAATVQAHLTAIGRWF